MFLGKKWVILGLILGYFCFQSCTVHRFVWSKSSGIVTYNRMTGQLEILWESDGGGLNQVSDSIRRDTIKH